jgi:hypothetical protein
MDKGDLILDQHFYSEMLFEYRSWGKYIAGQSYFNRIGWKDFT